MLKVEEGTLDFDLLKPLNTRLLVSVGRIRTTRLLEVAIGALLVAKGVRDGVHIGNWVAYTALLTIGVWIKFCLSFCLNCTTFWFLEVYGLYGLFDQIFDPCSLSNCRISRIQQDLVFVYTACCRHGKYAHHGFDPGVDFHPLLAPRVSRYTVVFCRANPVGKWRTRVYGCVVLVFMVPTSFPIARFLTGARP